MTSTPTMGGRVAGTKEERNTYRSSLHDQVSVPLMEYRAYISAEFNKGESNDEMLS